MDSQECTRNVKSEPSDTSEYLDTTNDSLHHDTSTESDQDECISTCHSASTTVAANTSSHQALPASTAMATLGESPSQAQQDALVPYLHTPTASTVSTTGTTVTVPVIPPRDDLDLILMHEDFPKILIFLAKVKQYRGILFHAPHGRPLVLPPTARIPIDPDADQVTTTVVRMQNQLLSPASRQEVMPSSSALASVSSSSSVSASTGRVVVRRGEYPFTDGTIDVAINSLENEFSRLSLFVQRALHRNPPANVGGEEKRSIAVKYSKWQTDLLMGWMINNVESPFPNPEDMSDLMYSTGLSNSQVVNWTTNVRKRNRKATVEDGKKPHHFLDFMFLLNHHNEMKQKSRERGGSIQDNNPPRPSTTPSSKKKSGSKTKDSSKPNEVAETEAPPSPLQSNPNATASTNALVPHHASASYQPQQQHSEHQQYQFYQQQQQAPHNNDAQYYDQDYEALYAQYQQRMLYQQHYQQHQSQYYYHPGQHHQGSIEYPLAAGTDTDTSSQADEAGGTTWSAESTSQDAQDDDNGEAQDSLGLATTTAPGIRNNNNTMVNDTAEMFNQLPFDGIGDDDMVLGGLSSMDNARFQGDTAPTTPTGIRLTQEQAFLCDWLPEILPSVTQETFTTSSSASAGTQDSDVAVSSTTGQVAGGSNKRGRASSLDASQWTASLLGGESADV